METVRFNGIFCTTTKNETKQQQQQQQQQEQQQQYSYFRYQIFAVFWMFCAFFWIVPRHLNFVCRCFGTPCLFHLHSWCKWSLHHLWRWNINCSETSTYKIQTPGNYPKRKNTIYLHLLDASNVDCVRGFLLLTSIIIFASHFGKSFVWCTYDTSILLSLIYSDLSSDLRF